MRSTPWPKLILRTVKLACGPLSRLMTTPSKACTRSLSPSLIFTWTRTVSPGRNAGMSVRWDLASSFSMIRFDMMVILRLSISKSRSILSGHAALDVVQNSTVFVAQFRAFQQVRTVAQRFLQCLLAPPAADLVVIAVEQNFRHRHTAKIRGTRVVRIVEQSAGTAGRIRCCVFRNPADFLVLGERFLPRGSFVSHSPRQQPRDRFNYYGRRQLATTQHVVADRQLAVG